MRYLGIIGFCFMVMSCASQAPQSSPSCEGAACPTEATAETQDQDQSITTMIARILGVVAN